MESFESEIRHQLDEVATELNLTFIFFDFEIVEDPGFYFIKQIGDNKCLSKISFEQLFLEGVVSFLHDWLLAYLFRIASVDVAEIESVGGQDRMYWDKRFFLVLEKRMAHDLTQICSFLRFHNQNHLKESYNS